MKGTEGDPRTFPLVDYSRDRFTVLGDPVEYDGLEWDTDGVEAWRHGREEYEYRLALRDPAVGDRRLGELQQQARVAARERATLEVRLDILTRISDLEEEERALRGELEPAGEYLRQEPVPIDQVRDELAQAYESLDSLADYIADASAEFIEPAPGVVSEFTVPDRESVAPSHESLLQRVEQTALSDPRSGPGLG